MIALAAAVAVWLGGWALNAALARRRLRGLWRLAPPLVFGVTLLLIWELVVRGLGVSPVLLPAPGAIGARIAASTAVLWTDFVQTVVKGALSGYVIGCGAAFLTGIAVGPRRRSCAEGCCRWATSSRRCRSSAWRRSW